jgi:hypothetical protein
MRKVFLLFVITNWLFINSISAQNPFKEFGVDVGIITLSKGKYPEFIPNDTIHRIGTVVIDTRTGKIIELINTDSIEVSYNYRPDVASRWISPDPLAEEYWEWSPYHYTYNNPIRFVDPDGRVIGIYDENGNYYTYNYEQKTFVNSDGDVYKNSAFIDAAVESLNYILDNDADTEGIISALAENSDIQVDVKYDKNNAAYLDGNIAFDFTEGAYTSMVDENTGKETEAGQQSPALRFLHELGHAYDDLISGDMDLYSSKNADSKDYDSFTEKEKTAISWYEDLEEHRVITKYETPAAIILRKKGFNEGARNNYKRSSVFKAACPSCTQSKRQTKKKKKSKK